MSTLNSFVIRHDDTGLSKFAFLFDALTDEVIEELRTQDDETIGSYFQQMGLVIAWVGHGDDTKLPELMQPLVAQSELQEVQNAVQ